MTNVGPIKPQDGATAASSISPQAAAQADLNRVSGNASRKPIGDTVTISKNAKAEAERVAYRKMVRQNSKLAQAKKAVKTGKAAKVDPSLVKAAENARKGAENVSRIKVDIPKKGMTDKLVATGKSLWSTIRKHKVLSSVVAGVAILGTIFMLNKGNNKQAESFDKAA